LEEVIEASSRDELPCPQGCGGGGIGAALVEAIRATERFSQVIAFSRSTSPSINLLDEASLERAAKLAASIGEAHMMLIERRGTLNTGDPATAAARREI
jgi:hypothetical protein